MKSLIKWLKENGFNFREVTLNDGREGLMVNTDYEGPYPTKECLAQQRMIEVKVRRFKALASEPRGHHTAVLITTA